MRTLLALLLVVAVASPALAQTHRRNKGAPAVKPAPKPTPPPDEAPPQLLRPLRYDFEPQDINGQRLSGAVLLRERVELKQSSMVKKATEFRSAILETIE